MIGVAVDFVEEAAGPGGGSADAALLERVMHFCMPRDGPQMDRMLGTATKRIGRGGYVEER